MIHVTCDLCGKELRPGEDRRYVVKIEVFAAHDPYELHESDLDDDPMEALSELLQDDAASFSDEEELRYKQLRHDLCADCRKKFLKNPLNREPTLQVDFSKN